MQNLQNAIRRNTIIMLSAETRNKNTSYRSISYCTQLFLEMRQANSEDVRIKLSLLPYAKTFLFAPDINCFHSVLDTLSVSLFCEKGTKMKCSLNLTWNQTRTILRARQWQGCISKRSPNSFQISMVRSTMYQECRQNTFHFASSAVFTQMQDRDFPLHFVFKCMRSSSICVWNTEPDRNKLECS
jgi:hypothetical protein